MCSVVYSFSPADNKVSEANKVLSTAAVRGRKERGAESAAHGPNNINEAEGAGIVYLVPEAFLINQNDWSGQINLVIYGPSGP